MALPARVSFLTRVERASSWNACFRGRVGLPACASLSSASGCVWGRVEAAALGVCDLQLVWAADKGTAPVSNLGTPFPRQQRPSAPPKTREWLRISLCQARLRLQPVLHMELC